MRNEFNGIKIKFSRKFHLERAVKIERFVREINS